jgi:hypothetical protein
VEPKKAKDGYTLKDVALFGLAIWVLLGLIFVAAIFRFGPNIPNEPAKVDTVIERYHDTITKLEIKRQVLRDTITKTSVKYDTIFKRISSSGDTSCSTLQRLLAMHRQLDTLRD